ncbi:MAG: glycoside hydrolase family protein [Enterobacterales bacterium endosymbiont of Blomia tropicalis]|uniref:glycoside hydrolase family protein n=1 Tax=Mixta mediterraneensis TaxID=2758443 RepID=UPI0025A7DCC3|nr:glycoside hydrolase family protein [Mixta mediterraneensis]MDL4914875.1 glycoside hydrolase family protein [Mixta mediterraneensis]
MSQIIAMLNFEEGYVDTPYLDTLGYPTVAGGIRIGPKGASLSNYVFRVPRRVGDVWKQCILESKLQEMQAREPISHALTRYNDARTDVLLSMAYQLGVEGVGQFKNMLSAITEENFPEAANAMLTSLWARQTPGRARRHAEVMRTGTYDVYRGLL